MRIFAIHFGANDWHVTIEFRKRMEFFNMVGKPHTSGGLRNPWYYRLVCFGPVVIQWYKDADLEKDTEDRIRNYY